MKKLLLALALCLFPSLAFAQCNGVFPPFTICGNNSGSAALPIPTADSVFTTGIPGWFLPELSGAKADVVKFSEAISIASGSGALTVTTPRFNGGDVGKLISIVGAGGSANAIKIATAGSGYTNGSQAGVTISGGTCSVQPVMTVGVVSNAAQFLVITDPGTCTVQPANPVSVTGLPGGTGATFNIAWGPLATTIASFTDSTHIGLTANSAVTYSGTTKTVVYGTDDTVAVQTAMTAANNRAASAGVGTAALCGRYAITSLTAFSLVIAANDGFSVVGICPTASLYIMGPGTFWGLLVQGTGDSTSTTITADSSYGATTVTVTSVTGFAVNDYIRLTSETSLAFPRTMVNRITGISGSIFSLALPIPFDIDSFQPSSVTKTTLASRITLSDFDLDCTGASGTISGALRAGWLLSPTIRNLHSLNCQSINSIGIYMFNLLGGTVNITDNGSGWSSGTDAATIQSSTGVNLSFQGFNANGFAFGLTESSSNFVNIEVYNGCCRGIKLSGAVNNTGNLTAGNFPPGWVNIGFDNSSQYNQFGTVSSIGGWQCLWSSGKLNIDNSINSLQMGNCAGNGIAIGSSDDNWRINNVNRFVNVASDSIVPTKTIINGPSGSPTRTVATLPTCDVTTIGWRFVVVDSTTVTWGGTITGGGTNSVSVVCPGTFWIQG